ncbi:hypothetical protein GCM10009663_53880 [Kitasatospora arboriphila]|uniref:Uncharacterized protein n=1 Tax=Kitasatospora arboriphila TaxID=258052 RepID=A0ABN1TW20_9ACTN
MFSIPPAWQPGAPRSGCPPTADAAPDTDPGPTVAGADGRARALASRLLRQAPELRLGLVPAEGGAEAPTVCGWGGPAPARPTRRGSPRC